MKQLFVTKADVFNPWGKIHFAAMGARRLAPAPPIPFNVRHTRRLDDGSYEILGMTFGTRTPWRIYRARTENGVDLTDIRLVHEEEGDDWGYSGTIVFSAELGRYICLKNSTHDRGFRMHVYHSDDAETWLPYADNPVFHEGDNWSAVWSQQLQRFVCYNKGLQRHEGKRVNELFLNVRRVVSIRTSADGFSWTPDLPSDYKDYKEIRRGMRIVQAPLLSADFHVGPDEHDPPDLEFYNGTVYEYEGRYIMSASDYAGSFLPPGWPPVRSDGHVTPMGDETLISRDGVQWERAFRHGGRAGGDRHQPMLIGDRMIFRAADAITGMPIDRVAYVTSWSNAIFDSASFEMPEGGLRLNLRVPGVDYLRAHAPYVMCELIDDRDQVVAGYDREGCILEPPLDSVRWPLRWGAERRQGLELAGTRVRVRFYTREASIFALTSAA